MYFVYCFDFDFVTKYQSLKTLCICNTSNIFWFVCSMRNFKCWTLPSAWEYYWHITIHWLLSMTSRLRQLLPLFPGQLRLWLHAGWQTSTGQNVFGAAVGGTSGRPRSSFIHLQQAVEPPTCSGGSENLTGSPASSQWRVQLFFIWTHRHSANFSLKWLKLFSIFSLGFRWWLSWLSVFQVAAACQSCVPGYMSGHVWRQDLIAPLCWGCRAEQRWCSDHFTVSGRHHVVKVTRCISLDVCYVRLSTKMREEISCR